MTTIKWNPMTTIKWNPESGVVSSPVGQVSRDQVGELGGSDTQSTEKETTVNTSPIDEVANLIRRHTHGVNAGALAEMIHAVYDRDSGDDTPEQDPLDALPKVIAVWYLWDPVSGQILSPPEHDPEFLDPWRDPEDPPYNRGESNSDREERVLYNGRRARAIEVEVEAEVVGATWSFPTSLPTTQGAT
jgi:hypothetical protein